MLAPFYGALMLVTIVWAVLYDLIFIPRFAATPGKLLFGLRLVSTNNKPLGFGRIVARSLARVLSGFPTFFIGFLIVAFEDQKRGLHDFLCGTRVVKKR
ncbi:MAG: transporter [Rariglobus sp.]|nr:transporter [Rariglobus sp.]